MSKGRSRQKAARAGGRKFDRQQAEMQRRRNAEKRKQNQQPHDKEKDDGETG